METTRTLIPAQKRSYAYEPLTLDAEQVYRNLSLCEFPATRVLKIISTAWDREDDEFLAITFSAHGSLEVYKALCIQRVMDCGDPDDDAFFKSPDFAYGCNIVHAGTGNEVDEDHIFALVDGRAVYISDIRPAIRAVFNAIWAASIRIARCDDPINSAGTIDPADIKVQGATIPAERRILLYEGYDLSMEAVRCIWEDMFCPSINPHTIDYIINLTVKWQEDGELGTVVSFSLPDGKAFEADLYAPCITIPSDSWVGEVRDSDEKPMRRDDTIWEPVEGPSISVRDAVSVLIAASAYLMESADQGYPD